MTAAAQAANAVPGILEASDPATRGRTVIADRVVRRVAAQACAEVEHVHPVTPALVGRVLQQSQAVAVEADVDGHLVQLRLQVAVDYPVSLRAATRRLRDHVRSRVSELCGLTVTDVDIRVAELRADQRPERRVQ